MSSGKTKRGGNPARSPKQRYRPQLWHRDHRFALAGIIAATGLTVLTGALGPSAATLTLGPRKSFLPPWYLPAGIFEPNQWLVSILLWLGVIAGGVGLWIGMRALEDGWKPRVARIFALGTGLSVATILVPPLTSADVLMYAAYGRLQATGRSPYETTPAEVFRSQFDAVLRWTEIPWQDTPSVYGPITSWTQLAANRLGGDNMHDIVFWLQVFGVVPFILASAGVVWMAKGDPTRQARAALLTVANPLLIWAVVAGAHNEALSVMFAVGGLMMMRKNPLLAGIGIGLAGCAKLTIGLYGLAMLWAYRREPKKAILLCLGAATPIVLAYVVGEPRALTQAMRNGGYVSSGAWAHPFYQLLNVFLTTVTAKTIIGVVSYIGLFVIAYMLSKVLPWQAAPGLVDGLDPRQDPLTVALRTALLISVAWLVTAMYSLPWYDLIAWVPLAVLAATRLDKLMLLRIAALCLAYIPGRSIDVGLGLEITSWVWRSISAATQVAVLVMIIIWWKREGRAATPAKRTVLKVP